LKSIKNLLVWALVLGISLPLPTIQVLAQSVDGRAATAAQTTNSGEFLSEVLSQHLILKKKGGFFNRSSTETRVDFDKRPSDLVDAFGINVKTTDELETSTYQGADGKNKLAITYSNAKSNFDGTRLEFDPSIFDIDHFVEHENIIALHNRDGLIFEIDRANLRRQFGRGYTLFSRVWRVAPEEGAQDSLKFMEDPYSIRGLDFHPSIPRDEVFKITNGSLLVIRKKADGTQQIVEIISPKSMLVAMTLPTVAIALAVDNEKLGVKVALAQLQEQMDEYFASRQDFFNAAKAQGTIEKIRSIEADSITAAVASLLRQLKDTDANQAFTIDSLIGAQSLHLSPAAREVLSAVFSKEGNESSQLLSAAVYELKHEIKRQMIHGEFTIAERVQFQRLLADLGEGELAPGFIEKVRASFAGGPVTFDAWASRDNNKMGETARDVIELSTLSGSYDVWNPHDRLIVAALYEFKERLTRFIKENGNHPQKDKIEKIRDSLSRLKSTATQAKLDKLVSELRGLADDIPENSLLDFIVAASLDQDSSLRSSLDNATLVHPKNLPFLERVKNSKFIAALNVAKSKILTWPNLTMAFAFSYLYLAKPFTDSYRPELAKAWAYQYGWLYLTTAAFAVAGRLIYQRDGAYAMGKIGLWIYGKAFSYPPLIGLAKLLGQENFAFATLHGVFPTPTNGGLTTLGSDVEAGRAAIVSAAREIDARRVFCRNLAFQSMAATLGVNLKSKNWNEMQREWRTHWKEQFKKDDELLAATQREALLSADAKEIVEADTAFKVAKFQRETEFLNYQSRMNSMTEIVANRLDEKFKNWKFANVLSADQSEIALDEAQRYASEVKNFSSTNLRVQSILTWARAGVRYDSPKLLAAPMTIYRATQKAVVRPSVARMVQSNWQADMAIQFLLDGSWNGAPFADPIKKYVGVDLSELTRSNMNKPEELFAQPGHFMNTQSSEQANLRQQDTIYTASAMTKAMSEMPGASAKIGNPFDFSDVPDAEKFQGFTDSAKLWTQVAFKPRVIGVEPYLDQNNRNNYRYALPKFYMQLITSGLIAHHPLSKIVGQTLFFSGLGLWGFALPWIPLNLGINTVNNILAENREMFLNSRTRFLSAVRNNDESAAKLELNTIKLAYENAKMQVEGLTDLGPKTLDQISLSDLKGIAATLESTQAPTPADVNELWNGTTSFIGAVTTTALGVPFFVFMMACPLPWWGQSLAGIGGLMLYPISIEGLRAYDRWMRKNYDPKKILRDGEKELARLEQPDVYALEISSRLHAAELLEKSKVQGDASLPSHEKSARLTEIENRFADARGKVAARAKELTECAKTLTQVSPKP
jgi:hypothetical protein